MKVGDIIRFRYTGARAKILEDYLDGSFSVMLIEDRDVIIAFRDDIVPEKDFVKVENSGLLKESGKKPIKKLSTEEMFYTKEELDRQKKELFQKPISPKTGTPEVKKGEKTASEEEEEDFHLPVFHETAPQNTGVWLAFVEQAPGAYTIYLVNDSSYSIRFEFELHLHQRVWQSLKQTINQQQYFPIGDMQYAQLNDSPEIKFNCPGLHLQENYKLKYQKWVKMEGEVPLLGIECHRHQLFSTQRIEKASQQGKTENLQVYTRQQIQEKAKEQVIAKFYNKTDIKRLAHFNPEIDLHIEKLVDDYKDLMAGEIFELQKLALEKYMQQAMELGITEVFIIHGLGEGKLQKAVEEYLHSLQRMNKVREFRNEYIQKYGFGATRCRI